MERFSPAISNTVMPMRTLGYDNDLGTGENLRRVVSKLPAELTLQWGREVKRRRPGRPSLEIFSEWLKTEVTILRQSVTQSRDQERRKPPAHPREISSRRTTLATSATSSQTENGSLPPYIVCKERHRLQDCPEFKTKTHEEKSTVVSKERLCWGCLNKGHLMRSCRDPRRCGLNG